MIDKTKVNFEYHPIFTIAVVFISTIFWSYLYLDVHLDIDIGWLLQCLERFLAGGKYGEDFYESNPPISFLIYLPAYPLYTYLGISAHISVLLLFMGYIAISNVIIYKLLMHIDYNISYIFAIISALITVQTWGAGISFASKDHLIFIFIAPLLLLQYLITIDKKPNGKIMVAAIIMGAIAICLKPHYAVIPALFFAHRLFVSRSLIKTIISPDFIGILILGVSYIGFIYVFTPEYIHILLPEINAVYGLDKPFPIFMRAHYLIYAGLAVIFGLFTKDAKLKYLIFIAAGLSIACFIPYYLQQKGFNYHALPFSSFAMIALFLGTFAVAKSLFNYNDISIWIAGAMIAILNINATTGGKYKYLTTGQFTAQPLTEMIDDLAWNNTYATYDMKPMLSALPYITDLKNGSRFSHIWTIYGLLIKMEGAPNEGDRQSIKQEMLRYVDMLAQDMDRYKPSVITIPKYRKTGSNEPSHNYLNFLMSSEAFKANMENYTFEATIPFDTTLTGASDNPEKIIMHDVYVLKQNHNLGLKASNDQN